MVNAASHDPPEPSPILSRIVLSKREEVDAAKKRLPLEDLARMARDVPPPQDFLAPLVQPDRVGLIAEIKKASPSKGLIRADFDPRAIAAAYAAGGAACISVLTDAPFFQGSPEIFRAVRQEVRLPLLRKEFMIDPYQFHEARAMGADAVLLITSILQDAQLADFHALALELGMVPLLETHSEADLRRALSLVRPSLLGINNRNLHDPDFRTDLGHTERMLPVVHHAAGDASPPPIVSESGIHCAQDVAALRKAGVAAVLVGESLMRQSDPGQAARELMRLAG